MSRVSIIVPVLNSKRTLKSCLDSIQLARNQIENSELLIIDHGSTDGSYEMLTKDYQGAARIYQKRGGTIASLRNYAAQMAQGDYLCFVDSDCVLSEKHLENAMEVFKRIDTEATGCKYDLPSSPHWVEETWSRLHRRPQDGYINYLNAGNFIIKKSVFDDVAGFNERLPTDEDADLGRRLWARGYKIYEAHDVSAVHLGNPKSLGAFIRKELWHGLGMFRKQKRSSLDKILVLTFGHCLLTVAGIVLAVFAASLGWITLALVPCCLLFVPFITLAYRYRKLGRIYRPFRSLLLYWLFFDAKACAMFTTIRRNRADS